MRVNKVAKSPEERLHLKQVKQQHKEQIKLAGLDPKRYINVPAS